MSGGSASVIREPSPKVSPPRDVNAVDLDLLGLLDFRRAAQARGEKRSVSNFDRLLDERSAMTKAAALKAADEAKQEQA